MQWFELSRNQIEDQLVKVFATNSILSSAMSYASLNGGKRMRPLLCVAAGMVSDANADDLHKVGAAVELIHCYSLVHDDLPVMDNDDLRRGLPTCHIKYGDAIAILAGDALQSMAFELISQPMNMLPVKQLQIINILANASGVYGMAGGQALDILSTNKILELDALKKMHSLKTGALIKASILCGFLVGENAHNNSVDYILLDKIANNLGLLFQVVDDILDYTSNTEVLGKTAHKDEAQQKATFVSLFGLEQSQIFTKQCYEQTMLQITQLPNHSHLLDLVRMIYQRNS